MGLQWRVIGIRRIGKSRMQQRQPATQRVGAGHRAAVGAANIIL